MAPNPLALLLLQRAGRAQPRDFGFAVTQHLREHLVGMLPDKRRRRADFALGAAHPPRDSAMLLHADFGMIEVHPVAALLQMSVFRDELVGRAHRGCHARRLENLLGFGGAALRGPSTYRGVEFVLVALAR